MEILLSALGINMPSLITQTVNLGLLLLVLYLWAYKPIMKKLDERSAKIKESLSISERVREQQLLANEDVKRRLDEASVEGQNMIARATRTAEQIVQQAQQDAQKQASSIIERARAQIKAERDDAIQQLRSEFADLTVLAAEKIIDRSLDKNAHREIIEKTLKETSSLRRN
jgi:F-type H+-transporting ATPase subunit b